MKIIGHSAFAGCLNLKGIGFPDGLEEIGAYAFSPSGLQSITIPPSVRIIHQGAFYYCWSLKKAVINEGLESLGTHEHSDDGEQLDGVFESSVLEKVQLPSTLKKIEYGSFKNCTHLKSISLPNVLEEIGFQAFANSGLKNVTLPQSMKVVHQGAFCQCEKLRKVILNEGLEVLGTDEHPVNGRDWYGVFQHSALEDVKLPSTLREIGQSAF